MAVALKSAKQEFRIPSLCETSPAYAAAIERKERLFADRASTEKEIVEITKILRTMPADMRRARIAELVGDQSAKGAPPRVSMDQLNERKRHLRDLEQAIVTIESRINAERSNASGLVCDLVKDEHRRRVREVCFKLLELREAMLSYSEMVDELNDQKQVAAPNTEGFYIFVPSPATEPDPSLGDNGQFALQAVSGKLWVKEGGLWVFVGISKGVNPKGAWDSGTAYNVNDVVSHGGSAYMATAASTNSEPPNTDWMVLASKGDTGNGYGGTSTTPLTIGLGPTEPFEVQADLAYIPSTRVRMVGIGVGWMDGYILDYTGTSMTVMVTQVSGTGVCDNWQLSTAGVPGPQGVQGLQDIQGETGSGVEPDVVVDDIADRDAYDSVAAGTILWVTNESSLYVKLSASSGDWSAALSIKGDIGPAGLPGFDGDDAWILELAVMADGARRVLKALSWFGGTGLAPEAPVYIGASGYVADLADAATIGLTDALSNVRNLIVNPSMYEAQEFGGSGTTLTASTAAYVVDQWSVVNLTDGVATSTRAASITPAGSPYRLRYTVTTADAALANGQWAAFAQDIEAWRLPTSTGVEQAPNQSAFVSVSDSPRGPMRLVSATMRKIAFMSRRSPSRPVKAISTRSRPSSSRGTRPERGQQRVVWRASDSPSR